MIWNLYHVIKIEERNSTFLALKIENDMEFIPCHRNRGKNSAFFSLKNENDAKFIPYS